MSLNISADVHNNSEKSIAIILIFKDTGGSFKNIQWINIPSNETFITVSSSRWIIEDEIQYIQIMTSIQPIDDSYCEAYLDNFNLNIQ